VDNTIENNSSDEFWFFRRLMFVGVMNLFVLYLFRNTAFMPNLLPYLGTKLYGVVLYLWAWVIPLSIMIGFFFKYLFSKRKKSLFDFMREFFYVIAIPAAVVLPIFFMYQNK